jgi:hypothetical protein
MRRDEDLADVWTVPHRYECCGLSEEPVEHHQAASLRRREDEPHHRRELEPTYPTQDVERFGARRNARHRLCDDPDLLRETCVVDACSSTDHGL